MLTPYTPYLNTEDIIGISNTHQLMCIITINVIRIHGNARHMIHLRDGSCFYMCAYIYPADTYSSITFLRNDEQDAEDTYQGYYFVK